MNTLVFDIETVPDVESGAKIYPLGGLAPREAAEVLFSQRRQETGGVTDFLRHHLHRVVAIAVLLRTAERLSVWSLGEPDSPERELIERFFDGIERYSPQLVSWNGRGFDLPVLHYRALLHGVAAPRYWELGNEDQSFRWNNYLSRYHQRHLDLMDALSGYEYRAAAPLHEVARMLGLPGKLDMRGTDVWERYLSSDIALIRNYCEFDVLNTYLIYLRFELVRGRCTERKYREECARLRDYMREEAKPHFTEFLNAWDDSSSAER